METLSEHAAPWQPSGLVTLTTDFGQRDTFVGVMKGVLLGTAPGVTAVDLTHEVAPGDLRSAAFHLRHAWSWFPTGTVHVVVVDPGVGSARRILLARQGGHVFLAPDNGLLSGVLGAAAEVRELDLARVALSRLSRTFHGRDVFAPAAGRLAAGELPETLAARRVEALRLEWPSARELPAGGFEAPVELVDRFGNAITALSGERLEPQRTRGWVARVAGREVALVGTYAEVAPGEPLALLDSFGCWEIAVRDGDAARQLGLARGDRIEFLPGERARA